MKKGLNGVKAANGIKAVNGTQGRSNGQNGHKEGEVAKVTVWPDVVMVEGRPGTVAQVLKVVAE